MKSTFALIAALVVVLQVVSTFAADTITSSTCPAANIVTACLERSNLIKAQLCDPLQTAGSQAQWYSCLCQRAQDSYNCYANCPDMVGEAAIQKSTATSYCNAAASLGAASTPAATPKATTPSTTSTSQTSTTANTATTSSTSYTPTSTSSTTSSAAASKSTSDATMNSQNMVFGATSAFLAGAVMLGFLLP